MGFDGSNDSKLPIWELFSGSMMMLVITREEAQEQGLTKYFTGEPCKHGHLAERYVNNNACVECKKQGNKKFKSENNDYVKTYNDRYRIENADAIKRASKIYVSVRDKDRHNQERRKYYWEKQKKSDHLMTKKREQNRKWRHKDHHIRYNSEPEYRCNKIIRNIMGRTLKAGKEEKEGKTQILLEYSAQEFREHIEKQFQKGMTWDNHGEWHVDHIYPISKFIEEGIHDPKIINALSNLKPIWKTDNLSKGSKVTQLL